MRLCFYCASPVEEGGDVCLLCGGLIPTSSGRPRRVPEDEPVEQEPAEEGGWLRRPKVRELEKPSPRTRLVEMAALAVFALILVVGGIFAFEMNVGTQGRVGALFVALGVVVALVVPALFFAVIAAVAVGAAAILLESVLAPLLSRASPHKMPSLPHSALAKTDALGGPPLPEAEDVRIREAMSAEERPDIQRLDGERHQPPS
jgi:hypothetical protein